MCTPLHRLLWVLWLVALAHVAVAGTQDRERFLAAERALKEGDLKAFHALSKQLRDYALYPYLEHAALERGLKSADAGDVRGFLERHADTPLADGLRTAWLDQLAAQGRWGDYLAFYDGSSNDRLRCHYVNALLQKGRRDEAFEQVPDLWLAGHSQPKACDPVFDAWRKAGRLTRELVWQRIALAMDEGQTRLARYLERYLSEQDRVWAKRWQGLHADANKVLRHQDFAESHPYREAMLAHAVYRLARRNSVEARDLWREVKPRYPFTADQVYDVERRIAFGLADEPDAGSYAFLQRLDPREEDERLHESRLHAALHRADWRQLLAWAEQLPPEQARAENWRYWHARALRALGREQEARIRFGQLATERSFYGFLAADQIGARYHLEHAETPVEPAVMAEVGALPGVTRARELHALERWIEARREWRDATRGMPKAHLKAAAVLAESWGWHDQAIFTLARTGYWDDLELRFPVRHEDAVNAQAAQHRLDPAWVFAVVRQESAFMQDARSRAGARGLMQLMPATAKFVARKAYGRKAPRPWELYDADLNISLGTAYLREVLNELGDHPVLATAAYNAGPHRVKRWLPEQQLDADVWVELVPFSETRGYLRRVLAYTIIYEKRLGLEPTRLSERLKPVSKGATLAAEVADARQAG